MKQSSSAPPATGLILGLVGVLVLSAPVAAFATGVTAQQGQPQADNTITRISITDDGSAQWTIQIRTRLNTSERREEYEAFQQRFQDNTSQFLGPFRTRMQGVVANAGNATGRPMTATNFSATTSIQEVPQTWGVVTYQFTWSNFAVQQDDGLVAGDIFQGGFFLASNDRLEVGAPQDYDIESTDPAPVSSGENEVTWEGRQDFSNERPRVVFAPVSTPADGTATTQTPANGTPATETPTTGSPSTSDDGLGLGVLLGGALVLALVGLGAVWAYQRRDDDGPSASTPDDASGPTPTPATHGAETASEGSTDEETAAEAMLTDEERVEQLVSENDGRMRQAAIAEEFDWSASKTSRVIGSMAEEGTVEKLQLGRENLVSLPDEDE